MASLNFSVPDDVLAAFNKAFAGTNKSASTYPVDSAPRKAWQVAGRCRPVSPGSDWNAAMGRTAPREPK
jgi:hypothetical protein